MGWLKFLSFAFNLFGVLFFMAAAGAILFTAAVGGGAGSGASDGAVLGAFMGGMMGMVAVVSNVLASLAMFFFGAVLWALRRLLEEAQVGNAR
jgi:hypothetical protein